jgi:hypothetical protein
MRTEINVAPMMLAKHEFWNFAQLITREEMVTPNTDLAFGADAKKLAALLCPEANDQVAGVPLPNMRRLLILLRH